MNQREMSQRWRLKEKKYGESWMWSGLDNLANILHSDYWFFTFQTLLLLRKVIINLHYQHFKGLKVHITDRKQFNYHSLCNENINQIPL